MRRWQFWIGLGISAVLVWVAVRGLRLSEVLQALREANFLWIIPGVAVYFIAVWARAWRWHYLLRPLKKISTSEMFPVVSIGYMGNNIYPARAGEVLRAFVLRREQRVPVSASLATIIVERALDGLVMLAFVFVNLGRLAEVAGDSKFAGSIQSLAFWGAIGFTLAMVAFLLMAFFPKATLTFVGWLLSRLTPIRIREPVLQLAEKFLGGLAALRSPLDVVMVLATSIVIWLLETGKYWFVMYAFHFRVSFFALMLMNGIVNLATTIPSAPGYIGTFDAPGIAVLEAFGVPSGTAAGYTLVLHAALWLPITLLGAYYMARRSLTWQSVREEMAEGVEA